MKISIICPLYNAEKYIYNLNNNILTQELDSEQELEILYVLTRSIDKSEDILKKLNCNYCVVEPKKFSHSLTRESMANKVSGDIIVFISQDVKMKNKLWLKNLVTPIISGECEASFSRQICENNSIEKYTREKNYPQESRVVSKKDIEKYGLLTFFYSDASSAVNAKIYIELNAYDGKDMPTNEDMYFAHKLIHAGYRIKYCADSEVYHSHDFTFKQLYNRYYDTGVFFKENSYLMKYKGNESGFTLAKYVFKRALKEKNIKVIFSLLPNFGVRYIAMKIGQK
ncbi:MULTISPECIES: glycosyltransferase family 2 protein [Clostridium]|uniref:glycosyltransferase n=1 Tax=Clostridium TaxID=1485 RepID=UPI0013F031B0|nr:MULTISPECIES: glycosyltransferase family 2 protein [Clostridium]MBY6837719.1 glycosyltransferase family 2 protein [Clostridium botulinum]NFG64054.1 glycosyltransferase family 2 protein [Clostridium botulinum]NFL35646.1 glycosyltransferase family 2 protein [Clostridium botulinum]NFM04688.1 glycosyltransferase family 2 protein [Clostridium botulinum]NFO29320.1 glycosyltransferase family 2 protein [Clostridium botulinum]